MLFIFIPNVILVQYIHLTLKLNSVKNRVLVKNPHGPKTNKNKQTKEP